MGTTRQRKKSAADTHASADSGSSSVPKRGLPSATPSDRGHSSTAPAAPSSRSSNASQKRLKGPSSSAKDDVSSVNRQRSPSTASGAKGLAKVTGGRSSKSLTPVSLKDGSSGRSRSRLWRLGQWLLAVAVVSIAIALGPKRWLEEGPLTVSELLQERLNVTLPPLSLPRTSIDALLSSTGFNASLLLGLTDTLTGTLNNLTDTLNDLTDSFSGGLTMPAQLRALVAQLPAFSLPQLGAGGGTEPTALRPGQLMARRGFRARHPVVIVPGFVTSGLELWQGLPCGQKYFRQRMWGTLAMVQAFMTDAACWFRHMELDPLTGLDPESIKVRAAQGLEAVDYFIQGYWVWGKLVEALADVGYDSNSLVSMPYDWRLAMPLLEERDGYFTRLRGTIESLQEVQGERVVIATHSYGENVVRAFMSWVEDGQPGWVDRRLAAVINIAGTSLGVPKAISALLSGETRDTAQLGALAGFLTSNLVPRATRTRVWRTWGSSYAMLPVGGPLVWGNASWAPDDTEEMRAAKRTYGAMVSLWPHNWQTVVAAAAATTPPLQLQQLVTNISTAADNSTTTTIAANISDADAAKVDAGSATGAVAAGPLAPGGAGRGDGDAGGCDAAAGWRSCDASGGTGAGGGGEGGSINASKSGGGSGSSSSSSPMSLIAGTLKKLVGSSSSVDPADFLQSEQVTRLDVGGFLALLREVGGALLDQHVSEWGATELGSREAEGQEDKAHRRATGAAEEGSPQAQQAAGGPQRLHRTAARRRLPLFPDATRTPLPNAPSTALVCLYGVGLPTERGYHYLRPPPPPPPPPPPAAPPAENRTKGVEAEEAKAAEEGRNSGGGGGVDDGTPPPPPPPPHSVGSSGEEANPEAGGDASAGWMIMRDVTHPDQALDVGVHLSDGDGTVPLISLGLMCRGGWRPGTRLNPANMRVVTREFKHRTVSILQDARGGPETAAHVEILGNEGVLQDVIRVAAGRVDEMEDHILSDIDRVAAAVHF